MDIFNKRLLNLKHKFISNSSLQGLTSVALYGLGNIRDERLNRMFQVLLLVPFQICLAA